MTHPYVFMKNMKDKGRGLFTHIDLETDTVVEAAPVIIMPQTDRENIDKTLLHDYIFEWQPGGQNLCCMALGNIPIYNHAQPSNCEYFMDYEQQTMIIKTIRAIQKGEELTVNYNGNWNDEKDVWFDTV